MIRKNLLSVVFSLFGICLVYGQETKTNFIVILTDDQGYNDLGCFGSQLIKTPHLDRMAKEGIRFTDFYAQPVCGPSRAALMTGSYPLRIAEIDNKKRMHPFVHPEELLIPELIKNNGYVSGCIGKWDLNGHGAGFLKDEYYPTEMGFDYFYGVPSSNDGGKMDLYRDKDLLGKVSVDSITQLYTNEALRFIETNKKEPFFLYIAHSMPHTKLGAGSDFKGKSKAGLYGDAVQEIDWGVGEIRKLLEKLDIDKNTMLVFTSDNGPWQVRGTHAGSAFPLRNGKTSTWEGGVRVPCVMWGPGVLKTGVESSRVTSTMDLLPTICSMTGSELPQDRSIDGKDISSVILKGKGPEKLDEIYFYYFDTHLQGVRSGKWKLVLPRPQAPQWLSLGKSCVWKLLDTEPVRDFELYDLESDMSERRDVAKENPAVVERLKILIEQARNEIGDYNQVGTKARFFEAGIKRPKAQEWKEKEEKGWKQEIEVPIFYDDGARM